MEQLDKVSLTILFQESAEAKQVMYQIINTQNKEQGELNISIIPFLSSVCDGWLNFFEEQNMDMELPRIENIPFQELVKSTRVSYKLYSDKKVNQINTILRKESISRLELLTQDYNDDQKDFIRVFGQEDLGVFFYNKIPYGNSSQMSIYLENLLKIKSIESIKNINEETFLLVTKYSENIAKFISSVVIRPHDDSVKRDKKLCIDSGSLTYKDYFFDDEERNNLLGGNLPKETQLFLFNILCQNNFINYVLPSVFDSKGTLYYRSKLQTYLTSIYILSKVIKKYSTIIDDKYISEIEQLIKEKETYFTLENKLRNNIFHYGIKEVPVVVFNEPNLFFKELVEFSVGFEFSLFIEKIDNSFFKINRIINELIKLN